MGVQDGQMVIMFLGHFWMCLHLYYTWCLFLFNLFQLISNKKKFMVFSCKMFILLQFWNKVHVVEWKTIFILKGLHVSYEMLVYSSLYKVPNIVLSHMWYIEWTEKTYLIPIILFTWLLSNSFVQPGSVLRKFFLICLSPFFNV